MSLYYLRSHSQCDKTGKSPHPRLICFFAPWNLRQRLNVNISKTFKEKAENFTCLSYHQNKSESIIWDRKKTIYFHVNTFIMKSFVTKMTKDPFYSTFTASLNLLQGQLLFLLPGNTIFIILCTIYPLSLLHTCPNHHILPSLTLSPNCSSELSRWYLTCIQIRLL